MYAVREGGARFQVNQLKLMSEIIETYRKHGWRLARVLLTDATRSKIVESPDAQSVLSRIENLSSVGENGDEAGGADSIEFQPSESREIRSSEVDALWFARSSAEGREAWELRLIAPTPYALFELFEPDEAEEEREDVRREMEARLREESAARRKPF